MSTDSRSGRSLEPIAAIAPTSDDIQARRNPRARSGSNRGGGVGTAHLALLYFVLAVLVGAGVAGGWYLLEQQRLLAAAQADLETADQRLQRLESRLSLTDQALSDSGTELQDQITLWEREARRAWQVAWVQNRPRIEALETGVARVDEKQKAEAETLRGVRSTVAEHAEVLGTQADIVERLSTMDLQLTQMLRTQRDTTDAVNGMRTTVAGMNSAVSSNSEAIQSIDLFRQQTNRALLELRGGAAPPPPAEVQ